MSTPHIESKQGDIAKTVLMPGDPLRAKFLVEKYLDDYVQINSVRNMFGYTGMYKGKSLSIMASGMGIPSIGIYSYELYSFYGVENIIRIGSAGSYDKDLNVMDIVLVDSSYSESSYAKVQSGFEGDTIFPTKKVNNLIEANAKDLTIPIQVSKIHTSDVFYSQESRFEKLRDEKGCKCVEMESFALFHNANVLNKNAACLLTISDSLVTKTEISALERQNSFDNMILLALEAAKQL